MEYLQRCPSGRKPNYRAPVSTECADDLLQMFGDAVAQVIAAVEPDRAGGALR